MAENSYRKEIGFALAVTGICALLTLRAFSYSEESSQFPRFLTLIMTSLSFLLIFRTLRGKPQKSAAEEMARTKNAFWTKYKAPVLVFLFTAIYVASIQAVGYFTSTLLFLVGSMAFFGRHRVGLMLIFSMLFMAVVYILFVRFLGLRLPEGLLF
ncbi:MAG: tripartite tricarboxylate transporter TctB family protein [Synergistales bacterium]